MFDVITLGVKIIVMEISEKILFEMQVQNKYLYQIRNLLYFFAILAAVGLLLSLMLIF